MYEPSFSMDRFRISAYTESLLVRVRVTIVFAGGTEAGGCAVDSDTKTNIQYFNMKDIALL